MSYLLAHTLRNQMQQERFQRERIQKAIKEPRNFSTGRTSPSPIKQLPKVNKKRTSDTIITPVSPNKGLLQPIEDNKAVFEKEIRLALGSDVPDLSASPKSMRNYTRKLTFSQFAQKTNKQPSNIFKLD